MTADPLVTTRQSKQAFFNKELMLEQTPGESAYFLVCLSPETKWLLITMLNFYGIFHNRFEEFSGEREVDQLVAEANEALFTPMACSETMEDIAATLVSMNVTLQQIRDNVAALNTTTETGFDNVTTEVADLDVAMGDLGLPEIADKIEPMLNGVGVILGAPSITP